MKRTEALSKMKAALSLKSYAGRTLNVYCAALEKHLSFLVLHPELSKASPYLRLKAYLKDRLQNDGVSTSTYNVEYNALVFFYQEVLHKTLPDVEALRRRAQRLSPSILSRGEVTRLLDALPVPHALIAKLMYGLGLKAQEVLTLRLRDLDLSASLVILVDKKHTRRLPIPATLLPDLRQQVSAAVEIWRKDIIAGYGARLPREQEKQKQLSRSKEWAWVFPSQVARDPRTTHMVRYPVQYHQFRSAFSQARQKLRLPAVLAPDSLRHSFAVHLAESMFSRAFPQSAVADRLKFFLGPVSSANLKHYTHLATPDVTVTSTLEQLDAQS